MPTKQREQVSLGALVSNSLRVRCLIRMADDKASPSELAKEFGEDLGTVAYHVKKLTEAGMIELVDSRPVNGSVEHFFRAIVPAELTEADNAALDSEQRLEWSKPILQFAVADAAAAVEAGSFAERADHVVIRYPASVDAEGFAELNAIYRRALDEALEVEARATTRRAENPQTEAISVRVVSLVFPMPTPTSS